MMFFTSRMRENFANGLYILADLVLLTADSGDGGIVRSVWRALPFLKREMKEAMTGFVLAAAPDDAFEVSEWFCGYAEKYGKYPEILTALHLLCAVWAAEGRAENGDVAAQAGLLRDAASLLASCAKITERAAVSGGRADVARLWISVAEKTEIIYGDGEAGILRMLSGLYCAAGNARRRCEYAEIVRSYLESALSGGSVFSAEGMHFRPPSANRNTVGLYLAVGRKFVKYASPKE